MTSFCFSGPLYPGSHPQHGLDPHASLPGLLLPRRHLSEKRILSFTAHDLCVRLKPQTPLHEGGSSVQE